MADVEQTIPWLVLDYWRTSLMASDDQRWAAHPLACVEAAMKGETDPRELGVADGFHAALIRLRASEAAASPLSGRAGKGTDT